jgi:hypothetical protein
LVWLPIMVSLQAVRLVPSKKDGRKAACAEQTIPGALSDPGPMPLRHRSPCPGTRYIKPLMVIERILRFGAGRSPDKLPTETSA